VAESSKSSKIKDAGPWAALVAMIPTLIVAWQSRDTAQSAQHKAREEAQDVLVETQRRDDASYRALRRALYQQLDAIQLCQRDVDDMSQALEELYEYVSDHSHRRNNDEEPLIKRWEPPAALGMASKAVMGDEDGDALPEDIEQLLID